MKSNKRKSNFLYGLFLVGVVAFALISLNSYKAYQLHKLYISKERWPDSSRRYHPEVGFEMTPSFSGRVQNLFDIKSHRLGFRIAKNESDNLAEKGGILFTGCSFTYGDELDAEYAFASLVADSLKIPTYNYGVCGYSYAQILLQLRELDRSKILDSLSASFLVLGAGNWLTERSVSPFYPSAHLQLGYAYIGKQGSELTIKQPSDFYSIQHLYNMKDVYSTDSNFQEFTLSRFLAMSDLVPRAYVANYEMNRWKPETQNLELYNYVFSQLQKIAAKHQMKLIVLWMTSDKNIQPISEEILKAASDNKVLLIDGGEALKELNVPAEDYVDRHPGKAAHIAYSKVIIKAIRSGY